MEWVRKTWGVVLGFPGGSEGKESACNAGDPGLIPRSGRSPGEGHGNPLQYSSLENLMDRGAGRLQSTGWERVRHNGVTNTSTFHFCEKLHKIEVALTLHLLNRQTPFIRTAFYSGGTGAC